MTYTELALKHLGDAEQISNPALKAEHLAKAQVYALLANAEALNRNTLAGQVNP